SSRLVWVYKNRLEGALPVGTLTEVLTKLFFLLVGALWLLHVFGFDITAVWGALGVGGLAVALALQDTLTNFFAGFYVSIAGQVRIGDFIRLESGQEGYVADIAWRSTMLRTLSNNLVVIPNNKLAQSIVTNYHLPEKSILLAMKIGVAYDSDPSQVEQVL